MKHTPILNVKQEARAAAVFLMIGVSLTACTARPAVWVNPNATEAEQVADRAQCRRLADAETEREFANDPNSGLACHGGIRC